MNQKMQGSGYKMKHLSIFAALSMLLVSGCATVGTVSQPEKVKTEEPPQITLPSATASGNDILKWMAEMNGRTRSLKGLAKVKIVSGRKETNAKEIVVIKRPSSFRLETLGLMGTPAMIIAADGTKYTIQVPAENKVLIWDRSSESPIPVPFSLLEADEIASVFLGGTPVIDYGSVDMTRSDLGKNYTLTLHSKDGFKKQVLVLDAATYQMRKSEITDGHRGTVISISYDGYQNIGGVWFPKKIEAQFLPRVDAIQVSFEEVELNPQVEDDLFVLKPLKP